MRKLILNNYLAFVLIMTGLMAAFIDYYSKHICPELSVCVPHSRAIKILCPFTAGFLGGLAWRYKKIQLEVQKTCLLLWSIFTVAWQAYCYLFLQSRVHDVWAALGWILILPGTLYFTGGFILIVLHPEDGKPGESRL